MVNRFFTFLVLCVLLVSCGNEELNKLDGYRGAKWGMSPDEVSKIDEIHRQRNSRGVNNRVQGHFVSHGYIFDLPGVDFAPTALVYHRDRLILVSLTAEDRVPMATVTRVIKALTDKYGAPKHDSTVTDDKYESYSQRNISWVGRKTIIHLYTSSFGGVDYSLSVEYMSREHMDAVRSYYDKTAAPTDDTDLI